MPSTQEKSKAPIELAFDETVLRLALEARARHRGVFIEASDGAFDGNLYQATIGSGKVVIHVRRNYSRASTAQSMAESAEKELAQISRGRGAVAEAVRAYTAEGQDATPYEQQLAGIDAKIEELQQTIRTHKHLASTMRLERHEFPLGGGLDDLLSM